MDRHTLADGAGHTCKSDIELLRELLTNGTDAAITQVIDIVNCGFTKLHDEDITIYENAGRYPGPSILEVYTSLQLGKAAVDDIDHLGNRRVRTVGEQLAQQFNIGLARMARTIRERMSIHDEKVGPADLVNARTVTSVINTFFGTNQLSQFMDQTNPLAEMTHSVVCRPSDLVD